MCVAQNTHPSMAAGTITRPPIQQAFEFPAQPTMAALRSAHVPLLASFRYVLRLRHIARARLRRDGLGAAFAYFAAATRTCPTAAIDAEERARHRAATRRSTKG